ncbi:MAG: PASTA domain-containing protein, partial [Clostridiales bacterium]|nr:PASTA domain-containing protein [Clostridiales bacterium]
KRYYPQSTLASNVIGFVGTDNYGLDGLEAKYDSYLTGEDGRVVRLKNVSGTDMLFSDYENYFDAKDGDDVTLTIDTTIQYYIEKHLSQAIADFQVQSGAAAIAYDPRNGEILALASYGNYDLNAPFDVSGEVREALDLIEDPEEYASELALARQAQWRNRAISDTYEPGSVFKTITLSIALEEGLVDGHSTFYCGGSVEVPGRTRPVDCWKHGGHGSQTLEEAVQNSCNVAFVNIGMRIGAETFYKYIEEFGFFETTGVDLPGEAGSLWWSPDVFINPNGKSELAAASFGQTFNITPIQLITAISAVVNGGEMYTPHVVKQISDNEGNIVYSAGAKPSRQVLSAETSEKMRSILESVVSSGTGANASVKGYRIGGKTGTSTNTVLQAETGGEVKEYIVSFCGIAPMDDPQIAILLLLDNPSPATGLYISGGVMAAPVVGNMFSDILPYLGVVPQYTEEEIKELNVTVPKLGGMYAEDVTSALNNLGLEYRFVGEGGTVTDQFPSAHAIVSPGTTVVVYMGAPMPDNEDVAVPDLTGRSYREAKQLLEAAGLFIRNVGVSASVNSAVVSIQSAAGGSVVTYGSVIEVTLVDKNLQWQY